jgi:hypothetical protein
MTRGVLRPAGIYIITGCVAYNKLFADGISARKHYGPREIAGTEGSLCAGAREYVDL